MLFKDFLEDDYPRHRRSRYLNEGHDSKKNEREKEEEREINRENFADGLYNLIESLLKDLDDKENFDRKVFMKTCRDIEEDIYYFIEHDKIKVDVNGLKFSLVKDNNNDTDYVLKIFDLSIFNKDSEIRKFVSDIVKIGEKYGLKINVVHLTNKKDNKQNKDVNAFYREFNTSLKRANIEGLNVDEFINRLYLFGSAKFNGEKITLIANKKKHDVYITIKNNSSKKETGLISDLKDIFKQNNLDATVDFNDLQLKFNN